MMYIQRRTEQVITYCILPEDDVFLFGLPEGAVTAVRMERNFLTISRYYNSPYDKEDILKSLRILHDWAIGLPEIIHMNPKSE